MDRFSRIIAALKENGDFTSMIDVVFLLLIFFMLQPFKHPDYLMEQPLDRGGIGDELAPQPVHLYVAGEGERVSYAVNNANLGADPSRIAAQVRQDALNDVKVQVVIHAGGKVGFGRVVAALDQCRAAGMEKVNFAGPENF